MLVSYLFMNEATIGVSGGKAEFGVIVIVTMIIITSIWDLSRAHKLVPLLPVIIFGLWEGEPNERMTSSGQTIGTLLTLLEINSTYLKVILTVIV